MLYAGTSENAKVLIMQQSFDADNQQATISNLSWLGGIIDGEGCISFHTVAGKKRKSRPVTPKINITNTDMEMITYIMSILDENDIAYYVENRKGTKRNKPSKAIIIKGCKRCLKFLPLIIPHLVNKRKRAELLYEFCVLRHNEKSRPYSEYEKQLCRKIYQLNGRNTIPGFDKAASTTECIAP